MRSWRLSTRILLGAAALWIAGVALLLAAPSILPSGGAVGLTLGALVYGGALILVVLAIAWLVIRAINSWIGDDSGRR